jgi:hypothetical protein
MHTEARAPPRQELPFSRLSQSASSRMLLTTSAARHWLNSLYRRLEPLLPPASIIPNRNDCRQRMTKVKAAVRELQCVHRRDNEHCSPATCRLTTQGSPCVATMKWRPSMETCGPTATQTNHPALSQIINSVIREGVTKQRAELGSSMRRNNAHPGGHQRPIDRNTKDRKNTTQSAAPRGPCQFRRNREQTTSTNKRAVPSTMSTRETILGYSDRRRVVQLRAILPGPRMCCRD